MWTRTSTTLLWRDAPPKNTICWALQAGSEHEGDGTGLGCSARVIGGANDQIEQSVAVQIGGCDGKPEGVGLGAAGDQQGRSLA
jgi:hypothetical protein